MTSTRSHPSGPMRRDDQHALRGTPRHCGTGHSVAIARSLVPAGPLSVLCLALLSLAIPREGASQTDREIRSLSREVASYLRSDEAPMRASATTIDDGDTEDGYLWERRPLAFFVYRAHDTGMTQITVDAEEDTRLIVSGPITRAGDFGLHPIAEDDDSGLGLNPEVNVRIRERGVYMITLAPYDPLSGFIDYEITVSVR